MTLDPQAYADVLVVAIKSALVPVVAAQTVLREQVVALESRWNDLGALRERVAVVEARPVPVDPAVGDAVTRLTALEGEVERVKTIPCLAPLEVAVLADLTKDLGALRERVAVVEVRPQLVGPSGEPGPPGKDGVDGKAGLTYLGVFQEGKSYDVGELVTWGGSMWHCNEATESKPGEGSKAWTLIVKRGRDGKDGKP